MTKKDEAVTPQTINTGVNVSKLNAYAVLAPMAGANITKLNAYAVLAPMPGANVTKLNAYAVLGAASSPVWVPFTFGGGVTGVPYSQSFSLDGSQPMTVTLNGVLPPGLTLSAYGLSGGTVSGTPTVAGTYTFALAATNAFGVAAQNYTITVTAGGSGTGSGGNSGWIY